MYLNPYCDISATLTSLSSDSLILKNSELLLNDNMKTIDETRLSRLFMLIEEYGTVANLSRALKVDDSQINQLKNRSPDSKTGKPKNIGNDFARRIERDLNKPHGWMDQPVYESDDRELNEAIDLLRQLPHEKLCKVKNIVNLVCEPESKYGNGENGNNGTK